MAPELPDPSFAKIVVLTPDAEAREALKLRLRQAIAEGLAPEARLRVTQLGVRTVSPPFPVAFRVTGPDPQVLRGIADQVQAVMRANPACVRSTATGASACRRSASSSTRIGCG